MEKEEPWLCSVCGKRCIGMYAWRNESGPICFACHCGTPVDCTDRASFLAAADEAERKAGEARGPERERWLSVACRCYREANKL